MSEYRIRIVEDDDFEPWGADEIIAEETRHIEAGDWAAYGTIVERKCPACGQWEHVDSLWGSVTDVTETGTYALPSEIPDEYLREVARDLMPEES